MRDKRQKTPQNSNFGEFYHSISSFYTDIYIGVLNKQEENVVLQKEFNPVFLNKILYLDKKNEQYLKYLFMIRDNKTISSDIDFKDNYNYPLGKEVINLVSSTSLNNIEKICDMCNLEIIKREDLLPIYNESIEGDKYLIELSLKGLNSFF